MDIEGIVNVIKKALPVILIAGLSAACAESTPEFRRNVQIRTDGPAAQCVLTEGRTAVALNSTPGSVLLPYSVERPLVECRNKDGWSGSAVVYLPERRKEQVVVIHMHR